MENCSRQKKNAPKPFSGFRANDDHPRSHLNSLSRRENALSPVTRADGGTFPSRGSQAPSPPASAGTCTIRPLSWLRPAATVPVRCLLLLAITVSPFFPPVKGEILLLSGLFRTLWGTAPRKRASGARPVPLFRPKTRKPRQRRDFLVCVVCVLGGRNRIGCYPFADCIVLKL